MKKSMMKSALALVLSSALLSACGTHEPKPDMELRQERSNQFRQELNADAAVEPLQGPLTLSTAIARAIKYNLDHRVKQMETTVAREQLNLARMSYLPEVTAMAGYSSRNNESGAISRSLATGRISLESSTSQEKSHSMNSLRASWDVIDFGTTYYTVAQKTDEILIAEEQRRKVVQNIIQDVQEAYWRAYIAQELSKNVDGIVRESNNSLVHFKDLANSGKIDPKEGLGQQRELLQIRYSMRSLQEQLAQGRIHLNALLNLPPGSSYTLQPVERMALPKVALNAAKLENVALNNRPELRMEDSKLKITNAEIRKSILEMFPHLQFWGQVSHDSNEYLYNDTWSEAGVQLTWNLLRAANGLGRKQSYEAEAVLAEARHKALAMAVVTQVHLALNRYSIALSKYEDASGLEQVSSRLADTLKRDTLREGEGGFGRIRANLQATATQMESMLAYAEVQNALMRLYNTLGIDPLDGADASVSIPELSNRIDSHLKEVNTNIFH